MAKLDKLFIKFTFGFSIVLYLYLLGVYPFRILFTSYEGFGFFTYWFMVFIAIFISYCASEINDKFLEEPYNEDNLGV